MKKQFIKYILPSLIIVILFGFSLSSCDGDKSSNLTISGQLENLSGDYFYAVCEQPDSAYVDTIRINDKGEFLFETTIDTLTVVSLYFNGNTKTTSILVDKGWNIKIEGDVLFPDLISVKGGEVNDDLTAFKKKNEALLRKRAETLNSIEANALIDTLVSKNLSELRNTNFELSDIAAEYIKANPDKLASVILIGMFFKDESTIPRLDENLNLLRGKAAMFRLAAQLRQYSNKVKQSQVNSTAPMFTSVDRKGKNISINDYRGKYVLLSFVSTTCNMCNAERPEMVKIYTDLKKKRQDIEFITIVIDTEEKAITKAINDSVKWVVIPEPGGWSAKQLEQYNIRELPYHILISPYGVILERDLPIESLPDKMAKLLPTK